jgi:Ni/Fe-hydrogenase subunit HybB-like protein
MIFTYTLAKIADTTRWANITAPAAGQTLADFYTGNAFYGYWVLFAEIVLGGVVPAIILISAPLRRNSTWRVTAFSLGVMGVSLNRWVMVLQVMAVPIMPFDNWALYIPSWQEVATTILPVAYGVILIMISYRYLPIFPQEAELNPIEEEEASLAAVEADTDATPELEPAQA